MHPSTRTTQWTKKDGTFSISDVPPGSYTLVAWQEVHGRDRGAGDGEGEGSDAADHRAEEEVKARRSPGPWGVSEDHGRESAREG